MRLSFPSSGPARRGAFAVAPLACAIAAALSMPAQAGTAPAAQVAPRDLGAVAGATPVSAIVWLKGAQEPGLDAAVASLYDPSSANYHQWLSNDALAAYGPTAAELAAARASLEAQGLHVDKVYDGSTMVHVSATAGALQSAFGTTIHQWQSTTRSFLRTSTAPAYRGANAALVGGVSVVGMAGAHPLFSRQRTPGSSQPNAAIVPQAGTDPLASFTTQCFVPSVQVSIKGIGVQPDGSLGPVSSQFSGTSYLDPYNPANRLSCGYTARQLVQHYGLAQAQAAGLTGRGQTIVIVDAYGSPTLAADVNTFSQAMGLPGMDAQTLQVVDSDGAPGVDDDDWSTEVTLDVEWAHAFAPEAKIVLVVAPSDDNAELAYAVEFAAAHHLGNVVSNSWGLPELGADAGTARMFNQAFKRAAARGVAVNVAAGDNGDNGVGVPVGAAGIPADSPYATTVGGTSIDVPADAGPVEAAWGDNEVDLGTKGLPFGGPANWGFLMGGGGGESVFLKKPAFQHRLPGLGRQTPDISAVADPRTGAIIVQSSTSAPGSPQWSVIGGTSLATPIFSAIWALADQAAGESLGQAAPAIAAMPGWAVQDVLPIKASRINTSGSFVDDGAPAVTYNPAQLLYLSQSQPTGFLDTLLATPGLLTTWWVMGFGTDSSLMAAPGWDNATGYGVPNGVLFITSAALFARNPH